MKKYSYYNYFGPVQQGDLQGVEEKGKGSIISSMCTAKSLIHMIRSNEGDQPLTESREYKMRQEAAGWQALAFVAINSHAERLGLLFAPDIPDL